MVGFESSLELDFIYRLDVDPDVMWFESQPLQIKFTDKDGREHRYTPDFLIRYRPGVWLADRVLVEVKFLEDLASNWEDHKPRLAAGGAHARDNNMAFLVYTEHEIRNAALWNAKFLWESCRRGHSHEHRAEVLRSMIRACETTVAAFVRRFDLLAPEERSSYVSAFWQLVAERQIKIDAEQRLTPKSKVWV